VHSMKDMPTLLPDGLTIACMLPREDVRDMLICEGVRQLADLPEGASVGTSSLRRAVQLQLLRPDIRIVPFRGNVQTRIEKMQQGKADATVLAVAGLNRLGIMDAPGVVLEIHECLPAVAQGAIGIECREGDEPMLALLEQLNDPVTSLTVSCERAFLRELDGSCRTPIAGYAVLEGRDIHLRGFAATPEGDKHQIISARADIADTETLGADTGKKLKEKLAS
jgi:hydroxymethylbilane synthase